MTHFILAGHKNTQEIRSDSKLPKIFVNKTFERVLYAHFCAIAVSEILKGFTETETRWFLKLISCTISNT